MSIRALGVFRLPALPVRRIPAGHGEAPPGAPSRAAGGWAPAPLRPLGDWSFALYLVHAPAMVFTAHYGLWNNSGGLPGLACLALVLAVSAALHYPGEKPVERRLRRWAEGTRY